MKTIILTIAIMAGINYAGNAQSKSSIAVTNPNVTGLYATPEIAAKLIRLELIKLEQYTVYDEFDMVDAYDQDTNFRDNCISTSCLAQLGQKINVDYTVSGSFDAFANKIIINIKIVDVANKKIYKSGLKEFDNQEAEMQRMVEILLKEMHGIPVEKELNERLTFKNEVITSNNVGKINNSGPRVGFAYMAGTYNEFATRSTSQGGLNIFPGISMIGYQIEGQYVGTENFSALIEGIFNIGGLEQGQFMPSVSLLNGFRFGKSGWEFAFGPSFGLKKVSAGFFDTKGLLGDKNNYYSSKDWNEMTNDTTFAYYNMEPEDVDRSYHFNREFGDTRGVLKFNTTFVIGAGRTFKAGALNIPVNVFYSSQKGGGLLGMSVGFNVMNKKKPINSKNQMKN